MKYLICNLKAHKTYNDMLEYKNVIKAINNDNLELILAPSSIYLSLFKNENISLCSQDLSTKSELYLTGDISIDSLKSLDVNYAILGHYERRKYYHEDETTILNKIKLALTKNMKVIYCIGETKEELARKVEYQVLEKQIAKILNNVMQKDLKNIIIAYEPVYMIGTNIDPNIKVIEDKIIFIKNLINNYYNETLKVVYGGNITTKNIEKFKNIDYLDGFIISTSALEPKNIKIICEKMLQNNK